MTERIVVPAGLEAQRGRGPAWASWLDALPALAGEVLEDWELALDGAPAHGECSVVLPARTVSGTPAVLKLGFPDEESEHEHLALRHWAGRGAVRLLRADPRRRALLLERLHAEDLRDVWDVEACEVVAGLYGELHRPAPPQLRPLTAYVERWAVALDALPREAPLPRRLVEQAVSLAADLVVDPASTGTLVHTDLHYANVLAADRAPWVVIDPKPVSGDPHYEPFPMLSNRWEEVVGSHSVRARLRLRFHTLVDAGGLDEHRARDWVVVRSMVDALWTLQDAERAGRALLAGERHVVTLCVAIAKAVQG